MQKTVIEVMVCIVILIVYIVTAHLIDIYQIKYIHESGIVIIFGSIIAIIAQFGFHITIQFSNQYFFNLILPPIIFAAGYNLHKSLFFQNFGIITFLGILGTILAFIVLSSLILVINNFILGYHLTTGQVLLLSSILCATDAVAALSLVKFSMFPILNSVLFGQGIINDATAIIIFRSVIKFVQSDKSLTIGTGLLIFGNFIWLFLFSTIIGLIFGLGLSFIFSKISSFSKSPIKEGALILLISYLSYITAEICDISGIIALFVCGIIMGHYCYVNITEEAQKGTVFEFETVGYLAEAFLFGYIGLSILGVKSTWTAFKYAGMIILVFPIARVVSVYILPLFYWIFKKKFPLNNKQLGIVWYSGLIRAFALSFQVRTANKQLVNNITLLLVVITITLLSMFLNPFANLIGLQKQIESPQNSFYSEIEVSKNKLKKKRSSSSYNSRQGSESRMQKNWQVFEDKYVRPFFTREKSQFIYQEKKEKQNSLIINKNL